MKILSISAKCNDMVSFKVTKDKNLLFKKSGVVPLGLGKSDYIRFDVDIETGQILNWDAYMIAEQIDILSEEE